MNGGLKIDERRWSDGRPRPSCRGIAPSAAAASPSRLTLGTPAMRYPCRETHMTANSLDRQLTELEACRYRFGRSETARVVKLLKRLDAARFPDSPSLIRFHEALLFLRAFPQGPSVVRVTERILNSFHKKVEALRKGGADMDDFDTFEVSGIAGTQMEDTLSFDVASWLVNIRRMRNKVEIAWGDHNDNYEPGRALGTTGPRFIPLFHKNAYCEADTPWRRWLETAAGKKRVLAWLISRFEKLLLPPQQKA